MTIKRGAAFWVFKAECVQETRQGLPFWRAGGKHKLLVEKNRPNPEGYVLV